MAMRLNGQSGGLPMNCVLPDGTAVLIRAAQPEDATRLERLFYRLSSETLYRYFFLPLPKQPQWAARLGALAWTEGQDHRALVAVVGGEIVGVARFDRAAMLEEAEFGILIEDAWQRRGLGKRLLTQLIQEARQQCIRIFTAHILGENWRALRLVGALFASVESRVEQGECLVRAPIAPSAR